MNALTHITLRHLIWGVVILAVILVVAFHRIPPRANPQVASTPTRIQTEVQAIIAAEKLLAASRGTVPGYAAPAVSVVREILPGFSGAQIAAILGGLKPKTVTAVSAHLVGPTPAPTPTPGAFTAAQIATFYGASKSAVADVLADPQTHIAVSLTQEEVPLSRVGSMFTSSGAGLGLAVLRKNHFEVVAGAVLRGGHLSPALSPQWLIPHTSAAFGPSLVYDRRFIPGVSFTVHF